MNSTYKSLTRAISRGDKHGIEIRWAYGRKVLTDPKMMSASGKTLRNGAAEKLIAAAAADGVKLSTREIQWRLQCARTYKTITQLRSSASGFADWTALVDAGFPAGPVDETPVQEPLFNQDADRPDHEQLGLFPPIVRNVPLETATMRHIVAYTDDMAKMTASYARSDEKRRTHCAELLAVVGGNLDCLYVDALDAHAAQHAAT